MKRTFIVFAVLCSLILFSAVSLPRANAAISNYNWIGTMIRNSFDSFYGAPVTAYEENTTANLVVNVYNDFHGFQINVSAVTVGFDWGVNYTTTECNITNPYAIPPYEPHVFTITFTVPSVLMASNFVTHSYTIYVEHVNSTTGNIGFVASWTRTDDSFAVFSSDQANAYNYAQQVGAYPTAAINGIPILTARARELIVESTVAKTLASSYYVQGDFSDAKEYYGNALNDIQEAYSNDTDQLSSIENSLSALLNGGGELLSYQGYAWLIFGIGFLLMGIGVVVYLTRRRPQPTISQPAMSQQTSPPSNPPTP
jgi:tetratricopeptide (TPR) repeat protein